MNKYVAFLRGINVGGNHMVEMPRLAKIFESLGFSNVTTYINSGNVLFETDQKNGKKLVAEIEKAITEALGFSSPVILRDAKNIQNLCKRIPVEWENDAEQKTDVLFLWDDVDSKETISRIVSNPNADSLLYIPGAIVWNVARKNYEKSGMHAFVGTKLYKSMTARNVNTVRKINGMMR